MAVRIKPNALRPIAWGGVYLILAGVIGSELDWGRNLRPVLPTPAPVPAAQINLQIQPEFALLPLEQGYPETTARPLFSSVRRPPPPPAPPKPAMQKGQFVLMGALITQEKKIALLREAATGKSVRVEQGKEIKGIMVTHVFPEKVVLNQYDDTEELVLKIQPMPKPAAAPKPGPGALPQPAPAGVVPPAHVEGVQPVPPNPGAGDDAKSLINRRRAARGLPPI